MPKLYFWGKQFFIHQPVIFLLEMFKTVQIIVITPLLSVISILLQSILNKAWNAQKELTICDVWKQDEIVLQAITLRLRTAASVRGVNANNDRQTSRQFVLEQMSQPLWRQTAASVFKYHERGLNLEQFATSRKNAFGQRVDSAVARRRAHLKIESRTRNSSRPWAGSREEANGFSWPGLRHPVAQCFYRTHERVYGTRCRINEDFRFRKLRHLYRLTFFSSVVVCFLDEICYCFIKNFYTDTDFTRWYF